MLTSNPTVRLAITMGDPAGIGPEIALKALTTCPPIGDDHIFVIGDLSVMSSTAQQLGIAAPLHSMNGAHDYRSDHVNILDQKQITPDDFVVGHVSSRCGLAAYRYILKGIDLAKQGVIGGVVTNPINKEALTMAGIDFPGHTEIFAHETGTTTFTMMFLLEKVAVVHVTTHCSLRQAIDAITGSRVLDNIHLLNTALQDLGLSAPRIAVGGLNPHAGEHGLFGTEEIEHIEPAISRARSEGIDATGPYPPDTVFMRAFQGEFDGIVSMIHDHGFVALKSRDFERGVNITVGLPIVRTSVGHGTGFDIAGKGIASEKSLCEALRVAHSLCTHRMRKR